MTTKNQIMTELVQNGFNRAQLSTKSKDDLAILLQETRQTQRNWDKQFARNTLKHFGYKHIGVKNGEETYAKQQDAETHNVVLTNQGWEHRKAAGKKITGVREGNTISTLQNVLRRFHSDIVQNKWTDAARAAARRTLSSKGYRQLGNNRYHHFDSNTHVELGNKSWQHYRIGEGMKIKKIKQGDSHESLTSHLNSFHKGK